MRRVSVTGFIFLCIVIGTVIGYWFQGKEFASMEKSAVKVENLSLEGIDILEQTYENSHLNLRIAINSEDDINTVITRKIQKHYNIFEQVFLNHNSVNDITILVHDQEGELLIVYQYSRVRYNQIDSDMGPELFKKYIENKGWDVLNNADNFRLSEDGKKHLHQEIKDRLKDLD